MIALYGQSEKPGLWQPDEVHIMQLQQIHTAVEGLQKQSTMLNNQLEAFSQLPVKEKSVMSTLRSLLKTITAKIAKLEGKMLEIINNHYRDTFSSLQTIPGIGPKTAIVLIAITNNFKKFDDIKKLSAYVGLSPRVYQSGTSINGKGHITKMGNKYVRKLLYLCAWSAKRHNKQCVEMYERLKEKQKPERVIKIAIANKLLRQAFAIAQTQEPIIKIIKILLVFNTVHCREITKRAVGRHIKAIYPFRYSIQIASLPLHSARNHRHQNIIREIIRGIREGISRQSAFVFLPSDCFVPLGPARDDVSMVVIASCLRISSAPQSKGKNLHIHFLHLFYYLNKLHRLKVFQECHAAELECLNCFFIKGGYENYFKRNGL